MRHGALALLLVMSACVTTEFDGSDHALVQDRYTWDEQCTSWLISSQTGEWYCASPEMQWDSLTPADVGAAVEPVVTDTDTEPQPLGPPDLAKGKTVYNAYCLACHQADGKALNGALGNDFTAPNGRMSQPDEVLLESIRDGKIGDGVAMPPWGTTLSEQDMVDALAYIRDAFVPPDVAGDEGEAP